MENSGNGNKACYEEIRREMLEETKRFECGCLSRVRFVRREGKVDFLLPQVLAVWY